MKKKLIELIKQKLSLLIKIQFITNLKLKLLKKRIEKMANDLAILQSTLDAAVQAMKDMETRVDGLITSLQTGVDLTAVIAEAQQIKDGLTAFHAATAASSTASTAAITAPAVVQSSDSSSLDAVQSSTAVNPVSSAVSSDSSASS